MNFIVPLAFAFAAVLPLIVLMYLLRLKRQKVVLSSILLWRKSIQDLQANAPFQKLRNNLLLWLQLLIACLLVFALARPIMNLAAGKGQSFVMLVDTSASMKAIENGGSRIDQARNSLKTMINDLGKNDAMMIVGFDREARVLQTFTDDRAQLLRVADDLVARDSSSQLRDALLVARSAAETRATPITIDGETAKGVSNVEVVVLSDGAIADLDRVPEDLPPVRYVTIGQPVENAGFVHVDLRQTFERESDRQIFATVENFGSARLDTVLECRLDGQMIDAKTVAIEPGANAPVIFTGFANRSGTIELRLNLEDAFVADNVVYGILEKPKPAKILIVGSKNVFMEKVLTANPGFEVFTLTPDQYKPSSEYDVTVFDNVTPPELPAGRYLLFNALPPGEDFAAEGEPLASPAIIDWNRVHPLTRYVNFESIHIGRAIRAKTPSYIQTLAEGETSPLIFAYERDQRQVVVVAFDIFQSDWPLRVSFPIFMSNALNYLGRSADAENAFSVAVGATIPFFAEAQPAQFEITSPSGQRRQIHLEAGGTAYYAQTDEVGIYAVTSPAGKRQFSVNLLSAAESNLQPKETLQMPTRDVKADASLLKQNREIWYFFALAALVILALEWLIYCRRAWA